jgi:hypothetical protein
MQKAASIRLVAIDLDDTLLNHEKEISHENLKALNDAQKQGIIITLVTGRMYIAATRFANALGLDVPIVTYQGGLIRTGLSHQTLFEAPLSVDSTLAVSQVLEGHNGMTNVAIDDIFYADSESVIAERYRNFHRTPVRVVGPFSQWLPQQDAQTIGPIYKIIYQDDALCIAHVMNDLRNLDDLIQVTRSYPHILEIGPKGIHKGFAIQWLAEHYKLEKEQIMVIGDGGNDIDMFHAAGFSVCMGNGQEAAKEAADYIGLPNDQDGVADALYRFVLKKG